jgi:hypothetical protein
MEQELELNGLLKKLVVIVNEMQQSNQKLLQNHSEAITANREAIAAIAELVNAQTRAFNVLRDVTIKLWEDRYGPDMPLPDATVN